MAEEKETKKFPATCLVIWPTGPVACCEKHAQGLVLLNKHLDGAILTITDLKEPAECTNCITEKKMGE